MKLSSLLDLDMGQLSDWLVDNQDRYYLLENPVSVNSVLDIKNTNKPILCWDGCDWHIDTVIYDNEGNPYLKEKTHVEAYMPIPELYLADNPYSLEKLLEMDMGELSDWVVENQSNFFLLLAYTEVDTPEDIDPSGVEVLCYANESWSIDYSEYDSDTGTSYMANGSEVEAFICLPDMEG